MERLCSCRLFFSPNEFLKNILKFNIGEFIPWLSDHCPLHTTIAVDDVEITKTSSEGILNKLHPGFIWNDDTKGRYTNGLKSKKVEERIQNLVQTKDLKPIRIATEIKDILLSNAAKCNLKKKKPKMTHVHRVRGSIENAKTKKQVSVI